MEPKRPGSKPKPPGPPGADSLSCLRALVVESQAPSGSVLFGYLSRPTAPRMPAVRPPPGTLLIEQSVAPEEHEIQHALSQHPMPSWSDRQGPPTQRPESMPATSPSPIPDAGSELGGTLTRIDGPGAGRAGVLAARAGRGRAPSRAAG